MIKDLLLAFFMSITFIISGFAAAEKEKGIAFILFIFGWVIVNVLFLQ